VRAQKRSWTEIAEDSLQSNFRLLAQRAGSGVEVMAVVKANAYGHGAERCAVTLARAGARWFGVADAGEGARVRRALDAAGYEAAELLRVCGPAADDAAELSKSRLTPVIWTAEQAHALAGDAGLKVHVELETGMNRQGCRPGAELDALLDAVKAAGLQLTGAMTHFCEAEIVNSAKTRDQQASFERGLRQIRDRGVRLEWVHAGSSSSLDSPEWNAGWLRGLASEASAGAIVRCGIGLYGYCNPLSGGEPVLRPQIRPVLTWKTRVLDVRRLAAGESVGYDSTYTARAPMRLALLPVGYADGLRRSLSSTDAHAGGWVIIRGQRAPIVGRVSMNLTMVDVSGIEGVAVGDEVILLGEGVTADDHARLAGTIAYEILCGIREDPDA
jgi:alanine racemase